MLVPRLAYRNLWRAPQRTLLTMGAMTTATTVLILTLSINLGFLWSMIITTTEYYHSHIQIVNPMYHKESDLHHTLKSDIRNQRLERPSFGFESTTFRQNVASKRYT